MNTVKVDYYKDLGVGKDASLDEVRAKYREAAMKFHPDKTGENELGMPKYEKWLAVNEAYQVLSNETKRMEYDKFTQTDVPVYEGRESTTQRADVDSSQNKTRTDSVYTEHKSKGRGNSKNEGSKGKAVSDTWDETTFNYTAFFGVKPEGSVSDFVRKVYGQGFVYSEPSWLHEEREYKYTYGNLNMHEPELNLMAGYIEALSSKGPFEADCGDYRIVKSADVGDVKGQIQVEVRLGRFQKLVSNSEIKVRKEGGWGYEVKSENDFVSVARMGEAFDVIGVNKPFNFGKYVDGIAKMAEKVARGEVIDGRDIIALDVEGKMCFHQEEGRVMVKAEDLGTEMGKRSSNWRIEVPEDTIFNHGRREGAVVDFGMHSGRRV